MRIDWKQYHVELRETGRTRWIKGLEQDPTWLNDTTMVMHGIWFIWAGKGQMRFRTGWRPLRTGMCVWLRPNGWSYDAKQDAEHPIGVNFIQFELVDAKGRKLPMPAALPPELIDPPDQELASVVTRRIVERVYGFGIGSYAVPPYEPAIATVGAALLQGLLTELDAATDSKESQRERRAPAAYGRRIQDVVMQIRENPQHVQTVAELAQEFGCSSSHFSRAFKAVTGTAPELYMVQARLHRAQRLLRETDWPMGEIAEACGYASIFFFSRQFRKFVGQSPSSYRRAEAP